MNVVRPLWLKIKTGGPIGLLKHLRPKGCKFFLFAQWQKASG